MKLLTVNNCHLKFELVEELDSEYDTPYEDEETGEITEDCEYGKIEVYYNAKNRVSIICEQLRYEGEEWLDETWEVLNLMTIDIFDKLIEYINSNHNITIYISQVFGTTSDFTIYTNTYIKSFKDFQDFTDNIRISTNLSYKYLIVNGNKIEKFV